MLKCGICDEVTTVHAPRGYGGISICARCVVAACDDQNKLGNALTIIFSGACVDGPWKDSEHLIAAATFAGISVAVMAAFKGIGLYGRPGDETADAERIQAVSLKVVDVLVKESLKLKEELGR